GGGGKGTWGKAGEVYEDGDGALDENDVSYPSGDEVKLFQNVTNKSHDFQRAYLGQILLRK
ncbi:hypothetical protein TrispH2_006424, partial [Trichoplax sp. H2]